MNIISTAVSRSKFCFLSRLKKVRNCKAKVGKRQAETSEHLPGREGGGDRQLPKMSPVVIVNYKSY